MATYHKAQAKQSTQKLMRAYFKAKTNFELARQTLNQAKEAILAITEDKCKIPILGESEGFEITSPFGQINIVPKLTIRVGNDENLPDQIKGLCERKVSYTMTKEAKLLLREVLTDALAEEGQFDDDTETNLSSNNPHIKKLLASIGVKVTANYDLVVKDTQTPTLKKGPKI
jgi:hypothetical protein